MSRGIVWSGGLLLGTCMVSSYTEKCVALDCLGGPLDVLELRDRKKGVLRSECVETYSNV